jgi:adenine-specific DNA glycosylase
VARWCATRGKGKARRALPERKRSIVAYALASRRGRFLLVQRSTQASLMPGMWELPSVTSVDHQAEPLFELRHSITTTDYRVRIYPYRGSKQVELQGRWVAREGLSGLPLTGLARKALRRAGAFA